MGSYQSPASKLETTRNLYHYTDAAGLKGIIESGVIRATHISFMNDASEYLHAVSLLAEAIKEIRATENDPLRISLLNEISDPVALTRPHDVAPEPPPN